MPETLAKGKGKEKEVEGDITHGSTLFVSNLPYTATSVDLQTLFSDIAPVRSAFIVTEQGTGVSKGVGYVSFALKEDAQSAFESISKDGINLVGRQLRIQWAENKPKEKKEVSTAPKPKPPRPQQPRPPHDPLAVKTIVVSGLPVSIDSKVLWKKMRKYDGAEKVDWPMKSETGEDDPRTAHVLFSSAGQASDAVNKLHAHVYKGSLLSVTLKKRLETLAKPAAHAKAAGPSNASRLIVRNIPFNATEQDLRAIFLPYGPIHSIHIPIEKKEESDVHAEAESSTAAATAAAYAAARRPRTKGFAFVWMLSRKDAEKAIEGCNGIVVRAGTAEALVSDKQKKKKLKRLEMKRLKVVSAEKKEEDEDSDGNEDEDEKAQEDDKRAMERVIAVDWALSKEKWKEERAKVEEDVDMDDAEGSGSDEDESDSEDEESEDEGLGVHSGSDEESDDGESHPDDDEERVKPELPPPESGTTLFIRNVPFNATEDELRTLFRSFGPLRYARITLDPATGRSRGTGFACFWNKEDADRAVQQSELLRVETTGQSVAPKKNPFSLPSILTPDPSSSLAQSLVLHGRTLDVVKAVTRDVAGKLKEDNERMREKADKRNMYLLREGVIMPNSPAAANLTPAEVERRTSSFNARRALLKSNPSLFISKTRLSVRQIPIFVTERMVKRLALHSLKSFKAEVKAGTRDPLTADELAEPKVEVDVKAIEVDKKKKKFLGRDTAVKQTKIVRQAERVDPVTGKGRSKGYGFVEMHRHADALRFLRWANNNPELGDLFQSWWKDELESLLKNEKLKDEKDRDEARVKRLKEEIEKGSDSGKKSKGTLIVEFSIENIQVVQRRSAIQKEKDKIPSQAAPVEKERKRKRPSDADNHEKPSRPTSKKARTTLKQETTAKSEIAKFANPLGSIIGRKRHERKGGKKPGK